MIAVFFKSISTTHTAITDQAGLSHINTANVNQAEVQNQLNEIITNDFNKEQALTELGAQVAITTEFGTEAPKRVAEFSAYQQTAILSKLDDAENLSDEQVNDILSEAAKWDEGGIYRVALHTATAAQAGIAVVDQIAYLEQMQDGCNYESDQFYQVMGYGFDWI